MKEIIEVEAKKEGIFQIEKFILSTLFLSQSEKERMLIIASETFDNIVSHSSYCQSEGSGISIKVSIRKGILSTSIIFIFSSNNFEVVLDKINKKSVYYDNIEKRYRGLGLIMCYNLSSSIHYRITRRYNAIRIKL